MSTAKTLKPLKLVVGILLVPCCVAITMTFVQQLAIMGRGGGLMRDWQFLSLALGFTLWLVVYSVLPQPVRMYVLGHELTHALWGFMMGAKIRNIKASAKGGQITLSKTNFLITLAPYFFPFYAMLCIILFLIGDLFFDWKRYLPFLCIAIGAGWGFHLTFTIATLSRTQSDVTQNGWLFSMTVIYWMNFLVLGLMLAIVSAQSSVWTFAKLLWREHVHAWTMLFRVW